MDRVEYRQIKDPFRDRYTGIQGGLENSSVNLVGLNVDSPSYPLLFI